MKKILAATLLLMAFASPAFAASRRHHSKYHSQHHIQHHHVQHHSQHR